MAETPKKKPYETDQKLWDMEKLGLETLEEKQLKELMQKAKENFQTARNKRIENTKKWVLVYKRLRTISVELDEKVSDGDLTPQTAIDNLRKFVSSDDLTKLETPVQATKKN